MLRSIPDPDSTSAQELLCKCLTLDSASKMRAMAWYQCCQCLHETKGVKRGSRIQDSSYPYRLPPSVPLLFCESHCQLLSSAGIPQRIKVYSMFCWKVAKPLMLFVGIRFDSVLLSICQIHKFDKNTQLPLVRLSVTKNQDHISRTPEGCEGQN